MKKIITLVLVAVAAAIGSTCAYAQENSHPGNTSAGENLAASVPGHLTYSSGSLYSNGIKLSNSELSTMLSKESYQNYLGAKKMHTAGEVLVIVGSIIEGAGIGFASAGAFKIAESAYNGEDYRLRHAACLTVGAAGMVVGAACLGAGIPLFCVGKHRIKVAGSEYNLAHGYPEISLNLGSTRNGFGISFNF
ncbi:MAG: hypothetical protein ACI395_02060 [Candidatus Cryptobacteroides sp.]